VSNVGHRHGWVDEKVENNIGIGTNRVTARITQIRVSQRQLANVVELTALPMDRQADDKIALARHHCA
jgi:hypothetical protein